MFFCSHHGVLVVAVIARLAAVDELFYHEGALLAAHCCRLHEGLLLLFHVLVLEDLLLHGQLHSFLEGRLLFVSSLGLLDCLSNTIHLVLLLNFVLGIGELQQVLFLVATETSDSIHALAQMLALFNLGHCPPPEQTRLFLWICCLSGFLSRLHFGDNFREQLLLVRPASLIVKLLVHILELSPRFLRCSLGIVPAAPARAAYS